MDETGRELPAVINWEEPEWVAFQRKRESWFADYAELPFAEKDGYLKFTVPEVKGFGMYVIT